MKRDQIKETDYVRTAKEHYEIIIRTNKLRKLNRVRKKITDIKTVIDYFQQKYYTLKNEEIWVLTKIKQFKPNQINKDNMYMSTCQKKLR